MQFRFRRPAAAMSIAAAALAATLLPAALVAQTLTLGTKLELQAL
jgi:hypothetical protein